MVSESISWYVEKSNREGKKASSRSASKFPLGYKLSTAEISGKWRGGKLEYLSPTHWWGLLPGLSAPWPVYDWTHQWLDRTPGVCSKRLLTRSVQSLIRVQLFVTPWTAARQASLSITNSQSLLKLMSIASMMPSNHLILCCPLLLPSIFPSIRVFSSESVLHIRWPKYVMLRTSKCKHLKQFHVYDYVQFHTSLYSKKYKDTDSLKYFTILKYIEAWRQITGSGEEW